MTKNIIKIDGPLIKFSDGSIWIFDHENFHRINLVDLYISHKAQKRLDEHLPLIVKNITKREYAHWLTGKLHKIESLFIFDFINDQFAIFRFQSYYKNKPGTLELKKFQTC